MGISNNKAITEKYVQYMDLHLYFDARMGTLSVSLPFCLVPEL